MKQITRYQARRRLEAAGIKTKIIFGTQLSARLNGCSISISSTDGRGRNMRVCGGRVYPLKGIGGTANSAVAVARQLVTMLNIPVVWESGSIQTVLQQINPDGSKKLISCVSPYRPTVKPLP